MIKFYFIISFEFEVHNKYFNYLFSLENSIVKDLETFAEWGYIGLFAACFIAATLIPMASEIVLSLFILTNYDFTTSIIVASLGSWVGGMSSY